MINVLFFAQLRDFAGRDSVQLPLGEMSIVSDLLEGLKGHVPTQLIDAISDQSAMVSINQQYAEWNAPLPDDAEVAILPPVSGG